MHLCIYDESTKRKKIERRAIAHIRAQGEPKRRTWSSHLIWHNTHPRESGDVSMDDRPLGVVLERLQEWEELLRERQVLAPTAHILLFAPWYLEKSLVKGFSWFAIGEYILPKKMSVHFPICFLEES